MRYNEIKQESFTNVFGEVKKLYVERKEKIMPVVSIIDHVEGMELDEVSARVFGAGSEITSYKLRDQNVKTLLLYDYDSDKIKKLEIGDSV